MTPHGVQRDAIATREPRGFFMMTPGVFHLGFFDGFERCLQCEVI